MATSGDAARYSINIVALNLTAPSRVPFGFVSLRPSSLQPGDTFKSIRSGSSVKKGRPTQAAVGLGFVIKIAFNMTLSEMTMPAATD
jgi:hypothetical protein